MNTSFSEKILAKNKAWSKKKQDVNPDFFKELAKGQNPPLLWIGCADSREPANQIIDAEPGDVFVHRNIANMVIHTDMNLLGVLDYAVNALQIPHIVVCGHYGCGGVKAAMSDQSLGLIDNWVRHIKDVYRLHEAELKQIDNQDERFKRMVELNVMEQVGALAKTSIVQQAWDNQQELNLHGWAYELETGTIKDLKIDISDSQGLDDIFKLKF